MTVTGFSLCLLLLQIEFWPQSRFICYVFKVDVEKSEQKFALRARHINQHRFVFYILSLCDFRIKKIEEALQHRKEVGTSASLVGHRLMQMTH